MVIRTHIRELGCLQFLYRNDAKFSPPKKVSVLLNRDTMPFTMSGDHATAVFYGDYIDNGSGGQGVKHEALG